MELKKRFSKLKNWRCLEHSLEDALGDIGNNHQVSWLIISQSINWSASQAFSPTHAVAHSHIGLLASSLSTGHESTLVHSLVCLSVCTPINQSVGQSSTSQSLSQPASQPISATQAAARSLVCSPVHPHIVSQALNQSVNQSISQS